MSGQKLAKGKKGVSLANAPLTAAKGKTIEARIDATHRFHFETGGSTRGDDSYLKQGDDSFNTDAMVKRREQLRNSEKLRNAALQFWVTSGKAFDGLMSFAEYEYVHQRITKVRRHCAVVARAGLPPPLSTACAARRRSRPS
jgi:hypothetical protein